MQFNQQAEEVLVRDIVVVSGIRPRGRMFDKMKNGRKSHGLLYVWEGEATYRLNDGRTLRATSGQLLYLPKQMGYSLQYTAENTTFVVVNFDLAEGGLNPFPTNDITLLAEDDSTHTIANIMAKFEMCSAAQNSAGQFRRKELFYRLLSLLSNSFDIEDAACPQILQGVLLLKQTYLENLPIEIFAKKSNISVSSFRQLFHKQYGMSPLQYRNRLRIRRAKQLLEDETCTVAEVAYASGFENIGYFCRCYKKITGKTPKQTKQNDH